MALFFIPRVNGPESSTVLYFEVRRVVAPVGRQTTTVFGGVYQTGASIPMGQEGHVLHYL